MASLACCACQAASCCVSTAFSCCLKAEGASPIMSKMLYAFQLIFVAIISYILGRLPDYIRSLSWWRFIPGGQCPEALCNGVMAQYRGTFALAIVHLILAICFIGLKYKNDPRISLQNGWWIIKFPLLILVFIAGFFIPNVVFIPFAWVALFGAGFFIIIQLVLLVDFAHTTNEVLVEKYEKTQSRFYAAVLLVITFGLILAAVAGSIVMYIFFNNPNGVPDCWVNKMFITVNIILCFGLCLFSINPGVQRKNPRAGLLQSSVVSFYSTYLIWSAISSEPSDMKCSTLPQSSGASLFAGVAITFIAVVYSALRVSSSDITGSKKEREEKEKEEEKKRLLYVVAPDVEVKPDETSVNLEDGKKNVDLENPIEESSTSEDVNEEVSYNYSYFHFTFFLAALYLTMVLTNWAIPEKADASSKQSIQIDQGMMSVWVKVVSSWVTIILYVWTLIAPICFPDREF